MPAAIDMDGHETRNSGDVGIGERYGYIVRQLEKKKKKKNAEWRT